MRHRLICLNSMLNEGAGQFLRRSTVIDGTVEDMSGLKGIDLPLKQHVHINFGIFGVQCLKI